MSVSLIRNMFILVMSISFLMPLMISSEQHRLYQDQVAVLMYHHVHETDQSSATITPELFENQLSFMQDKGYHFISLTEFEAYLNGKPVPDNAALVTFDDGYESFYQYAYPILKKLNIPAVHFMITEGLDAPKESFSPPLMSRNQITELARASDFIRAECHTNSLHKKTSAGKPYLTHPIEVNGQLESNDDYRKRVVNDAKACIRNLDTVNSVPVRFLAYPFGAFTEEAAELLTEGGIQYAFTIVPEMATRQADRMQIPRINAGSPFISPIGLHNTILRRVEAVRPTIHKEELY
jgi:poly-beta-1,6-N-acetyl-D-glucosamine N-deacetylase